jgi:hypothetical protein
MYRVTGNAGIAESRVYCRTIDIVERSVDIFALRESTTALYITLSKFYFHHIRRDAG